MFENLFSKVPKNDMYMCLHVCYVLGEDTDEKGVSMCFQNDIVNNLLRIISELLKLIVNW